MIFNLSQVIERFKGLLNKIGQEIVVLTLIWLTNRNRKDKKKDLVTKSII